MPKVIIGNMSMKVANFFLDKGYNLEEFPFVVFLNYAILNVALLHPTTSIGDHKPVDFETANNALQTDVDIIIKKLLGDSAINKDFRDLFYDIYISFGENKCHLISSMFENLLIQTIQKPEFKKRLEHHAYQVALQPYNVLMCNEWIKDLVSKDNDVIDIKAFTLEEFAKTLKDVKYRFANYNRVGKSTNILNILIEPIAPNIPHDKNIDPMKFGFVLVNDTPPNVFAIFVPFTNDNIGVLINILDDIGIENIESKINEFNYNSLESQVFDYNDYNLSAYRVDEEKKPIGYVYYLIPPNKKQTDEAKSIRSFDCKYYQSAKALLHPSWLKIEFTPFIK